MALRDSDQDSSSSIEPVARGGGGGGFQLSNGSPALNRSPAYVVPTGSLIIIPAPHQARHRPHTPLLRGVCVVLEIAFDIYWPGQ